MNPSPRSMIDPKSSMISKRKTKGKRQSEVKLICERLHKGESQKALRTMDHFKQSHIPPQDPLNSKKNKSRSFLR